MIYITSCQRFEEHIDSQLIYVVMLMELWGGGAEDGENQPLTGFLQNVLVILKRKLQNY